jgi:cytochrome c-type biogenesis protein CcmE
MTMNRMEEDFVTDSMPDYLEQKRPILVIGAFLGLHHFLATRQISAHKTKYKKKATKADGSRLTPLRCKPKQR